MKHRAPMARQVLERRDARGVAIDGRCRRRVKARFTYFHRLWYRLRHKAE